MSHRVTLTLVFQTWVWLLIPSHSPGDFSLEAEAMSSCPPFLGVPAVQLTPTPLTSPRPLALSL